MDFSALHFADVSRNFGRRRALSRVTFTAAAGTITALLGPNGAGKSTLLSIAATLLAPSSGRVTYDDTESAVAGRALRARIGLLGHDLYLYQELTAAENLRFFARVYAMDDAAREALRVRLREARQAGAIVLLTTHDKAAVEGLTDAAVTLIDGRLAA